MKLLAASVPSRLALPAAVLGLRRVPLWAPLALVLGVLGVMAGDVWAYLLGWVGVLGVAAAWLLFAWSPGRRVLVPILIPLGLLSIFGPVGAVLAAMAGCFGMWRAVRSGRLPASAAALRAAFVFGGRVRPDHAQVAAHVLATWDVVLTRTGGAERITQKLREFNPVAGMSGNVFGTWSETSTLVDRPPVLDLMASTHRGLELGFGIPLGFNIARYVDAAQSYAASWGVRAVNVEHDGPSRVRLILLTGGDPLAEVVTLRTAYEQTQGHGMADLGGVVVGISEQATPVSLAVIESHTLIGGQPGWGKSGLSTALLCGLGSLPHVALVGLDPKRVELRDWSARFSRIAVELDDMTTVLRACVDEMERRYVDLEADGRKKVTPDRLSESLPLLVVVVDELAEVLASGVTKEEKAADSERATLLRRLVAKGRAAGVVVIAATQKPDATTVPTNLRDLFPQRVAFRTGNVDMTGVILGGAASVAPAHEITDKGVCWLVRDGAIAPERARVLWVPDEEVAAWSAHLAPHRVQLPWLTTETDPDRATV